MKRTILYLVWFALLTSSSLAQQPVQTPTNNPPRAETTLAKTVVRITAKAEGVDGTLNATGFIVSVVDSRLPNGWRFPYLVTNRHVAEAIMPDASGRPTKHKILEMNAVVNLKQPIDGTRAHEIPLPPATQQQWWFPDDSAIDLAITPITLSDNYDLVELNLGFFFTQDIWQKYQIVPGDKVLTCGYFLHYSGAHQFQPIIREGSLAMVPDDAINVPIGGAAKVYLADLHIIPGNSGSPLFLAPVLTLGGFVSDGKGGVPYGLIGVVSGYMWEDDKLTLRTATDYEATIHANSGIAMIVPVDQLKELLNRKELIRQRDTAVALVLKGVKP